MTWSDIFTNTAIWGGAFVFATLVVVLPALWKAFRPTPLPKEPVKSPPVAAPPPIVTPEEAARKKASAELTALLNAPPPPLKPLELTAAERIEHEKVRMQHERTALRRENEIRRRQRGEGA